MALLSLHIIIKGKVQGVFCRAQVKKYADQHDLRGTVQNLSDNQKVEIHIEGEENLINQFTNWLKSNPGSITVQKIEVTKKETVDKLKYNNFQIIY